MKNTFKAFALGLSLLLANVSICSAQDFQKGLDAHSAGDYATALHEWRPLAEKGDVNAQVILGSMYDGGTGVTQDYKEAARLYGLAAAQGDAYAQSNLDALNKAIAATAEEMATPIASKLDDFRRQYPQYNDLSDEALTNALYAKFYSDIPRGQFDEQISSAVAAQGASDAFIRRIASTAALNSLILGAFLSFLIFRFTAYRYWKKVRVTAIQNGIWCGGGSGWVLLTYSPRLGRLVNQWAADHTMTIADGYPMLALDMYEHAYHMDYGAKAAAYVDAFMGAINWASVDKMYAQRRT